jgi:2-polyprenyl-3-methyl-5-hydroxy-6-metoxy-1,4-benzoquinol methylase
MKYYTPDISPWSKNDIRVGISTFDEEYYRKKYNLELGSIHGPLKTVAFNILELQIVDSIKANGGDGLDIGCGNGRFACCLLNNGYLSRVEGIDVSNVLIDNARQTAVNVDAKATFLRTAIENYEPCVLFDVITAVEVLEHIFALRDGLCRITSWLKPNALFVGSVPLGRVNDCDQHLHYFSNDSLCNLLLDYFGKVEVHETDVQGGWQIHLVFICRQPLGSRDGC